MNPHTNPYREGGNYHRLFNFMHVTNKRVVTRLQMIAYALTLLDDKGKPLTEKSANASVTVVMSPRKESKRGDCRGNLSAQGHAYFMEKLSLGKCPEGTTKRDHNKTLRYRLCWREPMLEPLVRVLKDADGKAIAPKRAKKVKVEAKATTATKAKKPAKETKVTVQAKATKAKSTKKPARKDKVAEPAAEPKVDASVDSNPAPTPTPEPVPTPAE
jgi:hypothetical protein